VTFNSSAASTVNSLVGSLPHIAHDGLIVNGIFFSLPSREFNFVATAKFEQADEHRCIGNVALGIIRFQIAISFEMALNL
jgi:hypothetical protein